MSVKIVGSANLVEPTYSVLNEDHSAYFAPDYRTLNPRNVLLKEVSMFMELFGDASPSKYSINFVFDVVDTALRHMLLMFKDKQLTVGALMRVLQLKSHRVFCLCLHGYISALLVVKVRESIKKDEDTFSNTLDESSGDHYDFFKKEVCRMNPMPPFTSSTSPDQFVKVLWHQMFVIYNGFWKSSSIDRTEMTRDEFLSWNNFRTTSFVRNKREKGVFEDWLTEYCTLNDDLMICLTPLVTFLIASIVQCTVKRIRPKYSLFPLQFRSEQASVSIEEYMVSVEVLKLSSELFRFVEVSLEEDEEDEF
ncbi:hypothetical protein PCE1_000672 [Barthelona sp. PCE]